MPVHKTITNAATSTELFQKLSTYNRLDSPLSNNGFLTLKNNYEKKVKIDFREVFINNSLTLDFDVSGVDMERISYSIDRAYKMHSFYIFLSSHFPQLIYSHMEVGKAAQRMISEICERRRKDLIDATSLFHVEESEDGTYVNITCDDDLYLKIDVFEERILIMYKNKMGLVSIPFFDIQTHAALSEQINELFNKLDISTQLDSVKLEGSVEYG